MNTNKAYEDLFQSFVSGGGLNNNEDFEDGFDDGFNENDFGGGRKKKASPKKSPSPPKKAKKSAPKKAKKEVNMDGVKVVEVDLFTIIKSSVGTTGGTYKSRTPRSAALKAAGALFKTRPSARTITFTLQKVTPRSNKRVYAYEASLEIFDEPEIVVKHDKNGKELRIPIRRKVSIKKIDVDENIRQEQKDALKAERKALRDKEKAKAKKEKKAMEPKEKKPKAKKEKKPKEKKEKKPKAKKEKVAKKSTAEKEDKRLLKALKKAEKEEAKLLKRADALLTKFSKKEKVPKKKPAKKPAAKGKGKKTNAFWGGGGCSSATCY